MKLFLSLFLSLTFLLGATNPYANISDSDKINALVQHFIQQDIDKLPKPPKKLNLKKDMFETTAQFNARVQKAKKQSDSKISAYKQKVNAIKKNSKDKALKKVISIVYGIPKKGELTCDADNQIFFTSIKLNGKTQKVGFKVPLNEARDLYTNYADVTLSTSYTKTDTSLNLASVNYNYKGKSYEALFTDKGYDAKTQTVTLKSDYDLNSQIDTAIT